MSTVIQEMKEEFERDLKDNQMFSGIQNDGSKNSFYSIPEWVKDCDDLADYLGLDFFQGNILKSIWGISKGNRHSGTNKERDLNKIIHYASKSKEKLKRESL